MENFNWTCPFCNQPTTITEPNYDCEQHILDKDNTDGQRVLISEFVVCPNPECHKFSLLCRLSKWVPFQNYGYQEGEVLKEWTLVPQSMAESFPDYIPQAIRDDYSEACLIKDLSPKASATLSRRCLQGIIRDFWGVKGGKLINEIDQIKDKVEDLTWQAIDAVRKVGNIGAHMEKDVNLIIDIEPNEAELFIHLIEILLKDWYIARHDKESHLKALVDLNGEKQTARKPKKGDA